MKKILGIIGILLLLTTTTYGAEKVRAIPGAQKVEINGKASPIQGYNINGYNYFKLRDLATVLGDENLNFELSGDYKEIHIFPDKKYKKMVDDLKPLGNIEKKALPKRMKIYLEGNGSKDYQVYNIDGYNYFKLREMGNLLGFMVDYDGKRNIAMIMVPKSVELSPNQKPKVEGDQVILGNERLTTEFSSYIDGKNIGIVTNQTGVDSTGRSIVEILQAYPKTKVIGAYSPEHGLDGKIKAGDYVSSYFDERYQLPVYSLYGKTRKPSKDMVKNLDVFVYDMQDIGSRTYTYISTLNYVMKAAKEYGKEVVVLDRPNPLGGLIVENFMLEPEYRSFVGVDEMPMAHGMTVGELAQFFNRKIGCNLKVIPMKGWTRDMVWKDTKLPWVQTSPNIPTIESAFHYMATGIGDGTGFGQGDKFHWVGAKGLDSQEFAKKMNSYGLPGVSFQGQDKGSRGGVKVIVKDYHTYNPGRTGVYLLATANQMTTLNIPVKEDKLPMFELIWGSDKMGKALKAKKNPDEIVKSYEKDVNTFKEERKKYLLY
ncbi:MAG: DUF1343 domain-containing protein [Tissierellia bacterium]|nr:DUF1343 domain-containing protein [Tissierellia bacterium]